MAAHDVGDIAIEFANIGYDTDDARPALASWASDRLARQRLDATSLRRVVGVHAAVCAVLGGRLDGTMVDHAEAIAIVNRASAETPVSPVLIVHADGAVTAGIAQPPRDLASLLAAISRSTIDLASSQADRLRRCEGPGCGRFFLRDRAHRNWCTLGCGNRARVARHYARHTTIHSHAVASSRGTRS